MKTKIVKTCELKIDGIVQAVGKVNDLAEHAAITLHRKNPALTDDELDAVEYSLRKTKRAEAAGKVLTIESIEEEYDDDEDN